ncbi:MAG: nuclear transport factor 2 family protein [Deltaproteobacteria bacterium]|nr:nuclear transport factor 2 family protein [Deltaproteobacteria bacterium]
MTTVEATPTGSDEAQIRQVVDSYITAVRAKDLNAIMSFYMTNVVAFDILPPLKYVGDAYRKVWQEGLEMMKGPIGYEFRDVNVAAAGDVAFCHGLSHMTMVDEGMDLWMRWTGCFRKIKGRWLIAHEHTSVPSDMQTGKSMVDLKP